MTEQYTPSDYDIHVQNPRIDQPESLITAEYEPPEGTEYSFPIANQGITQEQFRLMNLGQANGMIHGDNGTVNDSPDSTGYRYYLEGHDSDSETNQRNTLILRAGTSAESIVEGFYHRLTEDMELPFPAVTTTTVYHVTITYDPRDFKTSPLKIQVYPGEPPTSHGRIHLLLHTVERRPNQLLSQATITRFRQYTAGLISVQNVSQLPDVDSVPAGTLAVPSSTEASGIYVRSNTGPRRWMNTVAGPWENLQPMPASKGMTHGAVRRTVLGLQMHGRFNLDPSNSVYSLFELPVGMGVNRNYRDIIWSTSLGGAELRIMANEYDGRRGRIYGQNAGWVEFNLIIPDYYL